MKIKKLYFRSFKNTGQIITFLLSLFVHLNQSVFNKKKHTTPVVNQNRTPNIRGNITDVMQFNMELLFQLRELFIKYSILLGLKQY